MLATPWAFGLQEALEHCLCHKQCFGFWLCVAFLPFAEWCYPHLVSELTGSEKWILGPVASVPCRTYRLEMEPVGDLKKPVLVSSIAERPGAAWDFRSLESDGHLLTV